MKNSQKQDSIIGVLLFLVAVIFIIIIWYHWPEPQPTKRTHIDLSARNIGNQTGKTAGEFTKGFIRGVLGKDKGK